MGKYEDLEQLKQLKASGSITETEFEVEKYKILNSNEANANKTEGIYVASLVLGIIAFLLCLVPFLGLIITIVSLIICIIAKKKVKQTGNASGLVTAGLVLTIIGLIATICIHIGSLYTMFYNSMSVI